MLPKPIPAKLCGSVQPQYVRCGKPKCHCAQGALHGPYWYFFSRPDGYTQRKEYVHKADLELVRAACERGREESRDEWRTLRESAQLLEAKVDDDESSADPAQIIERTEALVPAAQVLLGYADGTKGNFRSQLYALDALVHYLAGQSQPAQPNDATDLLRRTGQLG